MARSLPSSRVALVLLGAAILLTLVPSAQAILTDEISVPAHSFNVRKIRITGANETVCDLRCNDKFSVFLVNQTTLSAIIKGSGTPTTPDAVNVTRFVVTLTTTYAGPNFGNQFRPGVDEYLEVFLYVTNDNENEIVVSQFDDKSSLNGRLVTDIELSLRFVTIGLFLVIGLLILHEGWKNLKAGEDIQGKMQLGYGLGYSAAFGLNILAEVINYWRPETGYEYPHIFATQLPVKILFDIVSLQHVFYLLLIGLLFASITFQVEKQVINRKVPFMAYNVIVASGLMFLPLAAPVLFYPLLAYFLASVIAGFAQVAIIYVHIIRTTTGIFRRNAIFILLGVVLPLSLSIIRTVNFLEARYFIWLLAEIGIIIGQYLFYKGLTTRLPKSKA